MLIELNDDDDHCVDSGSCTPASECEHFRPISCLPIRFMDSERMICESCISTQNIFSLNVCPRNIFLCRQPNRTYF